MTLALVATKIELAFGANLTGNPASWVWTDVSTYALGSMSVTAGRADEASQIAPTRCTFRLANTDARFTPRFPTSPYYPNVRRQTPVRVSLNPGTGYQQRFQGYIDSITPVWPAGNSDHAEVSVVASGILRRLGQGTKPIRSALYRALTGVGVTNPAAVPYAYWSFEDGRFSAQAVSPVASIPSLPVTLGTVDFGTMTGAPGSDVQPGFSKGGQIVGAIPAAPNPTAWSAEFVVNVGPFGEDNPGAWVILDLFDSAGIDFGITVNNRLNGGVAAFVGTVSSTIYQATSSKTCDDGTWHQIRMDAAQVGGNASFQVSLDGNVILSTTLTGFTLHPFVSTIIDGSAPAKISAGITVAITGGMGHLGLS